MSQEETENIESNEDSTTTNDDLKDVPDGGWGWFVVAGALLYNIQGSSQFIATFSACFLCNMVNDGIAYSFGIILEPMRSDLNVGVGSISLVGGALSGVTMLIGPVAAACVNR